MRGHITNLKWFVFIFLVGSLGCQGQEGPEKLNPSEENVQSIRKIQELDFPKQAEVSNQDEESKEALDAETEDQ